MRHVLNSLLIVTCGASGAAAGVCYVDRTSQMAENPFASEHRATFVTTFDSDGDGLLDVQMHYPAETLDARFFRGQQPVNDVPLWQNDTDVTFAGTAPPAAGAGIIAVADFDNDGWLDLYTGGNSDVFPTVPAHLYRNRQDGSFEDRTGVAGLPTDARYAAWGDFNFDGAVDLALSRFPATVWENTGGPLYQFVQGPPLPIREPSDPPGEEDCAGRGSSCTLLDPGPVAWIDIDQDRDLDLFIADHSGDPDPQNCSKSWLLLNDSFFETS